MRTSLLKFSLWQTVLSGALVCAALSSTPQIAHADLFNKTPIESFEVTSAEDLVRAYGVILLVVDADAQPEVATGQGTQFKAANRKAEVKNLGEHRWQILIQLDPKDYQPESKLSFVAHTVSGKIVAGDVRWLRPAGYGMKPVACGATADPFRLQTLLSLGEDVVQKLIHIRSDKADLLRKELRELLGESTLHSLNEMEKQYGLAYTQPIKSDTPLEELTRRLTALRAVKKSAGTASR